MSRTVETAASNAAMLAPVNDFLKRRVEPWVLKKLAINVIGFIRRTGIRILELEHGRVVCEMPLKGNKNHIGTMYAGALFTLAEFPGGALFLSSFDRKRFIPIVTDLNLQFLKPAKGPIRVEFSLSDEQIKQLSQEATETGKACFELVGELKDRSGQLVALSHAHYQIRRKP